MFIVIFKLKFFISTNYSIINLEYVYYLHSKKVFIFFFFLNLNWFLFFNDIESGGTKMILCVSSFRVLFKVLEEFFSC